MIKKTGFNRKVALTLSVLGAISPLSGFIPIINGGGIENVAEAAEGRHALSEEERIKAGYPAIPGMTFYSDGTAYKVTVTPSRGWSSESGWGHTGKILSYDKDSIVLDDDVISLWGGSARYNVISAFTTSGRYTEVGKDTNANRDMFKSLKNYHLEEVCTAYEGTVATGQGSTFDTHKELSNVCSYKLVPLNTGANSEDVKKFMKEAGVDAEGETIKITKPMETQDVNVDGKIKTIGDIEAGGDVIVHGSETIDHDLTVKGDETVNGNQTVDGDSRIHGDQTIDGGQTIYGDSNVKGSQRIQEDLRVDGNTQLGNDKGKDTLNVWAKTNLHGDTTIGDDEKDKFTVNATSEFKADATFDKNVAIKGNLEVDGDSTTHGNSTVDGDSTIHGNETIDKNLHVKGDSKVDGNSFVQGDLDVKGNTTLGDDKNSDTLDVNAKTHLHGDTTIGDDTNDKLTINATTEFGGESTFNKDVHIKGDLETDGNSTTHGNTITDGNALIYGNAGVAQNFYVGGDAKVDGDVYGKSFNIGNEKYIDKDGINANNHKIRNVADGEIGPNSLDAVNGRQLWHTREALQHNVNQVGAQTAAMANLHPMDFEYGDKVSIAAAIGGYQNQQAFALGAFVKPTQKSMFSLAGTLGMAQNMYGIGYTQKFGKKADFEHMTETQLKDELAKLDKDANEIREHDKQIKAENETLRKESRALAESIDVNNAEIVHLKATSEEMNTESKALREENNKLRFEISGMKAKDVSQENQIAALIIKNTDLEKSLSNVTKAYEKLMSKVDGMAEELAHIKADSKK